MSLGANIKKFRKARGYTQIELANRANISRSYLADVERDRYNPSVDTLTNLAKALGINPSILLGLASDINVELTERLKMILMDLSEGPYSSRTFPPHIKTLIEEETYDIRRLHKVDFIVTPDDIESLCREVNDDDFTDEIIRCLERVRERSEEEEAISSAFHDYDNLTEEELDYLKTQLEIFRKIKSERKK